MHYWDVVEGYTFVTGDNPLFSLDSRVIGPIPFSAISGVVIRIWKPGSNDHTRNKC